MNDDFKNAMGNMLIIVVINIAFLLLAGFALWLFGAAERALGLAGGFGMLWLTLFGVSVLGAVVERALRFSIDHRTVGFITVNLLTSVPLTLLWAIFLGAWARAGVEAGHSAILLYLAGFIAAFIGYAVVTSLHTGTIYALACLPAAMIGFVVFALIPGPGQSMFGWLF